MSQQSKVQPTTPQQSMPTQPVAQPATPQPATPQQSMSQQTYYLLAFESTHAALSAQSLLASLHPLTMPTPREISSSCGISLRFDDASGLQDGLAVLEKEHFTLDELSCYCISGRNSGRVVKALDRQQLTEDTGHHLAKLESERG